jgi:hypothetical protein
MGLIWEEMGFFRWPISLCFVVLVALGLWSALKLYRPGASPELRTKAWLDGVLVWGFLAFLFGILGAVIGIIITFQDIEAAGAVRPTVIAPGIKTVLLSSGFGTMALGFAVFCWFILQLRWRLLQADAAEALE